jgi:hypothetical protein
MSEFEEYVKDVEYSDKWGTPIGKDCISLNTSLCKWLGDRLIHLGTHTNGFPIPDGFHPNGMDLLDDDTLLRMWKSALLKHGHALVAITANDDAGWTEELAANDAMLWVAVNWNKLWD